MSKKKWWIREDDGVFDIMDVSGAFATCDNQEAAKLMCTAPEMLQSLKDIRASWVRTDDGRNLAMAYDMKKINAIIYDVAGEAI